METDQLAQLIEQKHQVLAQLRDLSERQLALVGAGGDTAPLLSVLAAKQQLIDQLTSLERQLDPYRQQDPDSRSWRCADDRARCALQAEESKKLLSDIMQREKQSMTVLDQRRDAAAGQLQAASSATEARHAYTDPRQSAPGRLDLTSET